MIATRNGETKVALVDLSKLLRTVDEIGSQKTKLLIALLEESDSKYLWYSDKDTRSRLATKVGVNSLTILHYLKSLRKERFIERPEGTLRGKYRINVGRIGILTKTN